MRRLFAQRIIEAAKADPRIIILSGDFGFHLFGELENNPAQYRNCGCAEQSMVGVAAGLAIAGRLPVVITITPFLVERAFEQIRLDVCAQKLHVILAGYCDYPEAGPTHDDKASGLIAQHLDLDVFWPRNEKTLGWMVEKALAGPKASLFLMKKYQP